MTPTIVFSSWHGRYSDSPRAISEELRRRGWPLRQVWLLAEDAPATPPDVERVPIDSDRELAAVKEASWIVSNDVLPMAFAKRPEAVYLQTWHGTPLKRIGYDVRDPSFPDADHHYAVELGRDVARWDVALSPNAHTTEVLRGAFRFDGPVLETGYPRNDVLRAPDRDAVRARVREALGIPDAVQAVLYAPTWRDDFTMAFEIDLDAIGTALGDEGVLLVRAHGLTAARTRLDERPGVRNVTAWPDIAELYLAADVLVTDYSSAMVDFAITGKPQLFYTYDLDEYRDRIRGFYVDFEAVVPGPLLSSSSALLAALRRIDDVASRHAPRYREFVERFCPNDDGRAAERVVDAVFEAVPTA